MPPKVNKSLMATDNFLIRLDISDCSINKNIYAILIKYK